MECVGARARPGHAGLGVDHDVADHAGPRQRRQAEQRGGRIAAGVGHEIGAATSRSRTAPAARRRPARSSRGRLVLAVPVLVDRAVAQPEVGRQIDHARARGPQLGDDRRRRAVRIGDDGGVDRVLGRRRRPRADAARACAGARRRAAGPPPRARSRAPARRTGGGRAAARRSRRRSRPRRGRRPQPRSSPSSLALTASTIFVRCGAISSSVSVRSPARNSSRTASDVCPSRA